MSKRTIFIIAAVVILLLAWWSCHHGSVPNPSHGNATGGGSGRRPGGAAGGPVSVVAGKAEQKDMPIYLDGLGTVQAFNTVTVHTRVDGELQQVLFTEGQGVKMGDLLA